MRATRRRMSWVSWIWPPAICVTLYGADVHTTEDEAKFQNLKPSSRGQFVPSHTLVSLSHHVSSGLVSSQSASRRPSSPASAAMLLYYEMELVFASSAVVWLVSLHGLVVGQRAINHTGSMGHTTWAVSVPWFGRSARNGKKFNCKYMFKFDNGIIQLVNLWCGLGLSR